MTEGECGAGWVGKAANAGGTRPAGTERPRTPRREGTGPGRRAAGVEVVKTAEAEGIVEAGEVVRGKTGDELGVSLFEIMSDSSHELGVDPGLIEGGVEAHLQELLANQIELVGDGHQLVRREYMTAIGPVDILARDAAGASVAIEIKRRGGIDGVEQLTRYLELMNRDPALAPVQGVFAAQEIKPQARTLAEDRGIRCLVLDYDAMRGMEDHNTLF